VTQAAPPFRSACHGKLVAHTRQPAARKRRGRDTSKSSGVRAPPSTCRECRRGPSPIWASRYRQRATHQDAHQGRRRQPGRANTGTVQGHRAGLADGCTWTRLLPICVGAQTVRKGDVVRSPIRENGLSWPPDARAGGRGGGVDCVLGPLLCLLFRCFLLLLRVVPPLSMAGSRIPSSR